MDKHFEFTVADDRIVSATLRLDSANAWAVRVMPIAGPEIKYSVEVVGSYRGLVLIERMIVGMSDAGYSEVCDLYDLKATPDTLRELAYQASLQEGCSLCTAGVMHKSTEHRS